MAVSTNDDDGNKLQEAILKYGELAFNPERPVEDRVAAEERFHDLIQRYGSSTEIVCQSSSSD
jgi:hypothetical protein